MSGQQADQSMAWRTEVLSNQQRKLFTLTNYVILSGVISLFGSVTNVINMVVFYRQGLDTTINISFFSLAISDLCGLIIQQMYNIFINPLFVDLNLPIVYNEIQYITTGLNREVFARITCLITAFVTAERCLCVVYPLHIKRIITPRITTTFVLVIFISTIISPYPIFFTSYCTWKFYQDSNRTLLGLAVTSHHGSAEAFVYLSHGLFTLLGFLSVLTFTLILIYKPGHKNTWRQKANVDQEKAKSMSKRDRGTITMVLLIAGILVVCYTPAVLLCMTTFLEPMFSMSGRYRNLCYSLWSFALLFENINSSVNIFLYYKISSKYRHTFVQLFSGCLRFTKNDHILTEDTM